MPIETRLALLEITAQSDHGNVTSNVFLLTNTQDRQKIWEWKVDFYAPISKKPYNLTIDIFHIDPIEVAKAIPEQQRWRDARPLSFSPASRPQELDIPGDITFSIMDDRSKLSKSLSPQHPLIPHKEVLARYSQYFNLLFSRYQDNEDVTSHNVPEDFGYETMEAMLQFMYNGKVNEKVRCSFPKLIQLYEAALFYRVDWLELYCVTEYMRLLMNSDGNTHPAIALTPRNDFDNFIARLVSALERRNEQKKRDRGTKSRITIGSIFTL
jgi:hypothetical protein